MENKTVSILGCGWLGLPLAQKLVAENFKVKGSKTTDKDFDVLRNLGIYPFKIKLTPERCIGNLESFLENSAILIIDIPPGLRNSSENQSNSFIKKIENCIPILEKSSVQHVVFISSTSVYGDSENYLEKTTEKTPTNPDSESGKQLIKVENLLLENSNFKTTILRFGGLIGPDRNPIKYVAGKKDVSNPDAPINFIHQTDCIAIIEKILNQKKIKNSIFNAVAPFHPTRKNYYQNKAKEENLEIPEFDYSKKSVGKTVDSFALQTQLSYTFLHPEL